MGKLQLVILAAVVQSVFSLMEFPDCVGLLKNNTVCNTSASPPERAAALVAAMTLTEKLGNLVDNSKGAPRIGLPPYEWWNEALHGVAASPGVSFDRNGGPEAKFAYATSFASPILLSSAFDDDLVKKVATVISTEARAFSNAGRAALDFWTPNINPYKDPRWGRGSETPGEDPFRIKGYVKALLKGLEGDEKIRKVIATCKHFVGNDMERWGGVVRYGFDAVISLQDLSEYYLPPFQQCARDSNVGSIMCSYNAVNGTPACANSYLMGTILRDHWGWKADNNYITSDCNAVQHFWTNFNYSADAAHAAASAIPAGTDTICEVPGSNNGSNIAGSYEANLLPEKAVDKALSRLYEGLVRAGYFDPASSSPYRSLAWSDVNTPEAQALAVKSATDGIVLKKNDGTLPIDFKGKNVAIIGHWGNASRAMLGPYSGVPPYYHSPVYAAEKLGLKVNYASGPVNQSASSNDTWTTGALAAAEASDIILYFGGTDMSVESEDLDRYSIALPGAQVALIEKLGKMDKPLVIAQLGDQTDDTPLLKNENINAILWAGFPGQSGGTAIFSVLTGETAPAGRLPVTQYPASYVGEVSLLDMTLRPSGISPGRTYRWYSKPVLPFGHGLHYTTFNASLDAKSLAKSYDMAKLKKDCDAKYPDLCELGSINIGVENTGNVTSDYVALVFVSGEYGPKPYPLKSLVGYSRLRGVAAGKAATASIRISLGDLARVDGIGNTVLYPGTYNVQVGVPAEDDVVFVIEGDAWVLDEFPQPPRK